MEDTKDYRYEITICFKDNQIYDCVGDAVDGYKDVLNIRRDNTTMVIPKKEIKYIIYKIHYKKHNV